jgi:hypothetical protein
MWKVLIQSFWLVTVVIIKQSQADDGQCSVLNNGVMHKGLYLTDSVFKQLGNTNLINCVTQCMMHVSCVGINHHSDKQECELLNVNVTSSLSNGTVPRDGYITSDIDTWPKVNFMVKIQTQIYYCIMLYLNTKVHIRHI